MVGILPRVDAKTSCSLSDSADLNQLSNAISAAVSSFTGSQCRVILNRRNKGLSKMDIYGIRKDMQHNNIELMGSLNR